MSKRQKLMQPQMAKHIDVPCYPFSSYEHMIFIIPMTLFPCERCPLQTQ